MGMAAQLLVSLEMEFSCLNLMLIQVHHRSSGGLESDKPMLESQVLPRPGPGHVTQDLCASASSSVKGETRSPDCTELLWA